MSVLCINNLTFSYADKPVLDRFRLTIPLDGLTAISGPSGCGKTTLLRLLAGLEKPTQGTITGISPERIAILFQEDRLLPWRTVREHILDVLTNSHQKDADGWLRFAELEESANLYPAELSGGMARRLALARCCAYGGELLLLDEPFAGVDAERRARILKRLSQQRVPALLATHEPDIAKACQRQILLDGPPLTLQSR
ncbi:MAG: ATP-binding cassette domain-containing protein [Lachnospiraceae bacterium]|nr:ATP-binding cassette domain-containing protein [Lachnospiraceae bacterium]